MDVYVVTAYKICAPARNRIRGGGDDDDDVTQHTVSDLRCATQYERRSVHSALTAAFVFVCDDDDDVLGRLSSNVDRPKFVFASLGDERKILFTCIS